MGRREGRVKGMERGRGEAGGRRRVGVRGDGRLEGVGWRLGGQGREA